MSAADHRYFTIEEANAMVSGLERRFGRLIQLKAQVRQCLESLQGTGFEPESDQFDIDPAGAPARVRDALGTLRTLIDALRSDVEELHRQGCIVKDLDEGLVDWYALKDGREVFLCWKLGEKTVDYWHETGAGFAGRRRIEEF